MFHTIPEAAFPMPFELGVPGMRAWRWIEFSLQVPYFLVSIAVKDGEFGINQQFLSAEIHQVTSTLGFDPGRARINSVCVLLPGYITGLETYSLHQISEVWTNKDDLHDQLFVTKKGERYYSYGTSKDDEEVERTCTIRL
jgi:hypothetical protein